MCGLNLAAPRRSPTTGVPKKWNHALWRATAAAVQRSRTMTLLNSRFNTTYNSAGTLNARQASCRVALNPALPLFWGSDSFPLQDERLYGGSGISRARRSSTPTRLYIWRLMVFRRLT